LVISARNFSLTWLKSGFLTLPKRNRLKSLILSGFKNNAIGYCDPAGIIRKLMIPRGGTLQAKRCRPASRGTSHFLFSSQNLSLAAFFAHKIKNAPHGASFVL